MTEEKPNKIKRKQKRLSARSSGTRSDGLAGLKAFLEFAARGITALPNTDTDTDRKTEISEGVIETTVLSSFGTQKMIRSNIKIFGYLHQMLNHGVIWNTYRLKKLPLPSSTF